MAKFRAITIYLVKRLILMKISMKFILFNILFLFTINVFAESTINLKDKVFVENGDLYLKDVAEIVDEDTNEREKLENLFITSAYFRKLTLSKQFLKELVKKAIGEDFRIYGRSVKVYAGIEILTEEKVINIIEKEISKKHNFSEGNLKIKLLSEYNPIEINSGNNQFKLELQGAGDNQYLGLQKCVIRIYFNGKFHRRLSLNIKVERYVSALIAKRLIKKNENFDIKDYFLKTIKIESEDLNYITEEKYLKYCQTNQVIEKDSTVHYDYFDKINFVEKGKEVDVYFYSKDFITVRKAISQEDGYFGKVIKIKIDDKLIFGEVIGKNKILVQK